MNNLRLEELKQNYNKTLQRYKKAEGYLDKATDEQFDKWCPEFNKIIVELSKMMKEYECITKSEMPVDNVLEGFKGVQ